MEIKITKERGYYKLHTEQLSYIFIKPIPDRLKIITLIIMNNLPKEIKENILEKIIIDSIRDEYVYELILREYEIEEDNLYYQETYGIS